MIAQMHAGRSWHGHEIEDQCPCPQESCGLVAVGKTHPDCTQHGMGRSLRQGHWPEECPALAECRASVSGRCLEESQSGTACDIPTGECVHDSRKIQEEP